MTTESTPKGVPCPNCFPEGQARPVPCSRCEGGGIINAIAEKPAEAVVGFDPAAPAAAREITGSYRLLVGFNCNGCQRQIGVAHPQAVIDAVRGAVMGYRCQHCGHEQFMKPDQTGGAKDRPRIVTPAQVAGGALPLNRAERRAILSARRRR